MEMKSFHYTEKLGWTVKDFPKLDSTNTLILIFAAPEYINYPIPIQELAKHYPSSKIIGCSSAGEILGSSVFDHSICVCVIKFEKTELKSSAAKINHVSESYQTGKAIAEDLNDPKLKNIFVLSEGLNVNGSELVAGINSVVDNKVIVTGGLAGDGSRFKETWCICKSEIQTNFIVAVGFYGDSIIVGHGSKGGWDIFGLERRITSSKENILYELDNKPALALYKEYLGERASGLPATGLLFPLAIRKDKSDPRQLVRTILAIDEEKQSLTFAGDVPQGYLAQLMKANFDRLIQGATDAGQLAENFMRNLSNENILVIAISCVGRRLVLGDRVEEEVESTLSSFPNNAIQIGFYSYGELSPYEMGTCDLHNQTMTITTIREKK